MKVVLTIDSIAAGGAGVARDQGGRVVFVPFTVPGERVEAEITLEKSRYAEAVPIRVLEPSPLRTAPACRHFGACGGCELQHMTYEAELASKERILCDALERLGGLRPRRTDPLIPSPREYGYRARARFHVRRGRWGFFRRGTRDVVELEECPVLEPLLWEAFEETRGFLRGAERMDPLCWALSSVEMALSSTDRAVVASFSLRRPLKGLPWGALLKGVGILKGVEVRSAGALLYRGGSRTVSFEAAGLSVRAPVSCFAQANREQNSRLIERAMGYASLKGTERVLELYSGAGNLTAHLARASARLVALDSDPRALRAAEAMTRHWGVENVEFVCARAADWLHGNLRLLERDPFHVVVLDPPRTGDREAVRALAGLGPRAVLYISCSPPTMARDAAVLAERGYVMTRASLVDLFPRTSQVEALALLERPS